MYLEIKIFLEIMKSENEMNIDHRDKFSHLMLSWTGFLSAKVQRNYLVIKYSLILSKFLTIEKKFVICDKRFYSL